MERKEARREWMKLGGSPALAAASLAYALTKPSPLQSNPASIRHPSPSAKIFFPSAAKWTDTEIFPSHIPDAARSQMWLWSIITEKVPSAFVELAGWRRYPAMDIANFTRLA